MTQAKIAIRNMRLEDIPLIQALEAASFPGIPVDRHWKPEQLAAHITTFPEGQFVAVSEGVIIGSATGFLVSLEKALRPHRWTEITGGGNLGTHEPDGDVYYGTEIMVHPDARRRGVGRQLYRVRQNLVRRMNLRAIVTGGRIPEYEKHADRMSPADYVKTIVGGGLTDRTLSPQLKSGFTVAGILTNYLTDPRSLNNATLLVWWNLDHAPARVLTPTPPPASAAERTPDETGPSTQ